MASNQDPVVIIRKFFALLEAMDMEPFFALWDEHAQQEMPFAPEGFPSLLPDKAAIRKQYGSLPGQYSAMKYPEVVIHSLTEPGWVCAEYRGEIDLKKGGQYNNRYIGLFHVEQGKIVLLREYFNPIVLQQSLMT